MSKQKFFCFFKLWNIEESSSDSQPLILGLCTVKLYDILKTDPIRIDIVTRCLDAIVPITAFNEQKDQFKTICTLHLVITLEDYGPADLGGDSPESFIIITIIIMF